MKSLQGYLFVIGATIFWGVSATIAKFLFTQHVDALVLVQTRITISCIILLIFFLLFRRDVLWVEASDLYRFALVGIIGVAGSNYAYYFTIQQTNVATAILLQYLAPLLVLGYMAFTGEEKLTSLKLLAGIVSLAGCFLAVAGKDFSMLSINRLGLISGLCAALCWGFTNIRIKYLLRKYSIWTTLIYSFIFASVFWMFFNPPWNFITAGYSSNMWGMFVLVSILSILIPHTFYFAGISRLTASRAIITGTFEPIIAIVSAFVFLSETLVPVQILGAALVIAAIVILQLKQDTPVEVHE